MIREHYQEMFNFSLVTQSVVPGPAAAASPEVVRNQDLRPQPVLMRIYILTRSWDTHVQISVGSIILMSIGLTQINDLTSLGSIGALYGLVFHPCVYKSETRMLVDSIMIRINLSNCVPLTDM